MLRKHKAETSPLPMSRKAPSSASSFQDFDDATKVGFFRKLWSLSCLLFTNVVVLFLALIIFGVFGFVVLTVMGTINSGLYILPHWPTSSFTFPQTNIERLILTVETSMTLPKVIIDTMKATLDAGLIDFDTFTKEQQRTYTYNSLNMNFERMGFEKIIVFSSNDEVDQFLSYQKWSDHLEVFHRYEGLPGFNMSEDVIWVCFDANVTTGECLVPEDAITVPWDREGSITHQARSIYSGKFVSPYLFFCPGPLCDIFFAYTNPLHVDGSYVGAVGCAFESNGLKPMVVELTDPRFQSYIVDVSSGFMILTSNEEPVFIQPDDENDPVFQILAAEHPNELIRRITLKIETIHGGLQNVPLDTMFTFGLSAQLVEYERRSSDGADWLMVHYGGWAQYHQQIIFFVIVYSVMLFLVMFLFFFSVFFTQQCVIRPIKHLMMEMKKIESLEFSGVEKRKDSLYEVFSLQRSFYWMLRKLEEFKAFLPHQFTAKRDISAALSMSSHGSSNSSDSSVNSDDSSSSASDSHSKDNPSTDADLMSIHRVGAFALFVKRSYCAMLRIHFPNLSMNNIHYSTTFSKITDTLVSEVTRGVISDTTYNSFVVVFRGFNNTAFLALNYMLNIVKALRRIGIEPVVSLVSGMFHTGVIGSELMKVNRYEGELRILSENLIKHAIRRGESMLVNKDCADSVFTSELSKTEHAPQICDVVVSPEVSQDPLYIYSIVPVEKIGDGEWLYVKDHEERMKAMQEKNNFVQLLAMGDFERSVLELDELSKQGNTKFDGLKKKLRKLIAGEHPDSVGEKTALEPIPPVAEPQGEKEKLTFVGYVNAVAKVLKKKKTEEGLETICFSLL